ncbi:DNA polymerase/3'-5' exonuclease PolX [Includes: DNA polymerase type-X; 3'-5' exodeoxyribonuclease] [Tepidanaerobacter acetatoxydans Re1]|uniref:DNA polymerase beta n=1 Tax=Tepidanaerobacter acetatoxydans (strain DSM 21804 / JCM 16047 / Re1) TaxID=1209989 RepID=F4LW91_TEPAE|nr:DNA polymerase/3'-5' exonuclease PolX [Tepidanaerobacter acetatoxydans]AEE90867.1 PHP domain protein [Tepidanaerobacter acetatoxydans Re1]CCP25430.1 DNA polymerase/3'-5' exonuclease PolX [Includes: DNA polymerase type-X; 3'-5' exodeoxyribonuclease] [Tepidanaerobacter acetatoxydans Re1]
MRNFEVAFIFNDIANMLEIKGENFFKIRAYRKAAYTIENLPLEIEDLAKQSQLQEIEGIGKALSEKIYEIIDTGTCRYYEELKKNFPPGLVEMLKIPGMGAKKIKLVYDSLGISSIEELEEAARRHKLRTLPGIGVKTEQAILKGIQTLKNNSDKILLATALPIAERISSILSGMTEVTNVEISGSLRRKKEMVKDIDIVIATESPEAILKDFLRLPYIAEVLDQDLNKVSVMLNMGIKLDLSAVKTKAFCAALQCFTGSKEHNTKLQNIATNMGYELNEHGILKKENKKVFYPKSEKEVYEKLGMPYIIPELREGRGEIEAAMKGCLPEMIKQEDIRGDLHVHSNFSDGVSSMESIAKRAKALGYEYIAITDHSKSLRIAGGLNESRLKEQIDIIRDMNNKLEGIRILAGAEVDILTDGTLDFADDILKELDIVIASIHSGFRQDRKTLTKRIVNACHNPYVNIIAHPTGRILGRRAPYDIDMDLVFEAAATTGTVLEINASPDRLDLNDVMAKRAKEMGIKIAINTDAHDKETLTDMKYGLWVARRGWLEPENVINTFSIEKLLDFLKVMQ